MAKKEKTIKEKEKDLRQSSIISGAAVSLLLTYFCFTVQAYMSTNPRANLSDALTGAITEMTKNPLYFLPINYNIGTTMGIVIIVILFMFVNYTIQKIRLHHDMNTLKGSSKWADLHQIAEKYADFEGNEYKTSYSNAILSNNVQMSINQKKHYHALNTLILGATGSGKSRYYLKPNLLQMNCSYVVTDPSGGILQECGETLRRFGYNVRVFDLVQMGNCDTYNPLKYCHRESDIKKITQAFIKNTDPTGGKGSAQKDPFWDDAMNAFMCAMIALLTTCPEGSNIPYGQTPEVTGGKQYYPCFATLCELTRMANKKNDPETGVKPMEGTKLGDGKNNTANASELAQVFENLRMFEARRQNCEDNVDLMIKPYCLREWENFRIAPEKTSTTILMTTAVRLDPFNIEQVRGLTTSDTLDLDTFGNKRDILFVITPTNDRTYNFLVSFLYTQLFDILYFNGETKSAGSLDIKLENGELVKHYSKEEVMKDKETPFIDKEIESFKNAEIIEVNPDKDGKGYKEGYKKVKEKMFKFFGPTKTKTVPVKFFDGWYELKTKDGYVVTRRPDKHLIEQYKKDLHNIKKVPGNGQSVPSHVRFLLDEFPNLGEIPEFKEKLATMRKYEISCTVICQTITQLKGMYENDYEVIDTNCPQTVFLGGDENSNNEYISKKIGTATVKAANINLNEKNAGSTNTNVDGRELLKPEELGRIPFTDEIVLIYGEDPIYDQKYDYPAHKNYKYTHDYACDLGIRNGVVFDRSIYAMHEVPSLISTIMSAIAVPEIQKFTPEAFKSIMQTGSIKDAIKRTENNQDKFADKKISLETSSEAMAF